MNLSPLSASSWPIVVTMLVSHSLMGQTGKWENIPGPRSADVYSLCLSPAGYVLAGVSGGYPPSGGVYISTDEGETWQFIDKEDGLIHSILIGPGRDIYSILSVSGKHFYIYRSTDDGFSWKATYVGDHGLTCLAVDENGWMFAGTVGAGILRSTDGGRSWLQIGLEDRIHAIQILVGDTIVAGTDKGLYYSADAALSWKRVRSDSVWVTAIVRDSGGFLFAGTRKGLYRSTTGGKEWEKIAFDTMSISSVYTNANGIIVIGTATGEVHHSSDRGVTWVPAIRGGLRQNIRSIVITYNGAMLAGTETGVMRLDGNSPEWKTAGFIESQISTPSVSALGTVFVRSREILFKSNDLGTNWIPINLPTDIQYKWDLSPVYSIGRSVFMYTSYPPTLHSSTDEGEHWDSRRFPEATVHNTGFGCWWNTLYFSSDSGGFLSQDGKEWHLIPGTALVRTGVLCVTATGDIIATLGRGTSARLMYLPAADSIWQAFHADVSDHRNFFATPNGTMLQIKYSSILRLSDDRESWINVMPAGMNYVWGFTSDRSGNVFLGTYADSRYIVFASTDDGESWNDVTSDFPTGNHAGFAQSGDGNVYLASSTRLYLFNGILTPVSPRENLPASVFLSQNYPNPFNPVTTIRFNVPERSYVTMHIYDNAGREVAKLVDEEMPAGDFSIVWNAQGLPSGAYHVRTIVGRFESTFKALLVK